MPSRNIGHTHNSIVLKKLYSCTSEKKEIRIKELQKVNKIFISSLFKKNKNYLGIYKFKKLLNLTNKKVVALGGISKNNIKLLNILDTKYFAGISFFE